MYMLIHTSRPIRENTNLFDHGWPRVCAPGELLYAHEDISLLLCVIESDHRPLHELLHFRSRVTFGQ